MTATREQIAARRAAQIAYRVCSETRHVSLGIKASDAILAEFGLLPTIDGEMTDEHFDRDERR